MIFSKTVGKPLEKALDIVGEILAFVVIILLAVSFINARFDFISNPDFLKILAYTRTYAVIGVVAIVGLEFVIDKGLLLTLIYLAFVAVVIIFSFFPEVSDQIAGTISNITT